MAGHRHGPATTSSGHRSPGSTDRARGPARSATPIVITSVVAGGTEIRACRQTVAAPFWSPDGARIVFGSNKGGQFDIYQKPAGGLGAEEPLVTSDQFKLATGISTDGRFLMLQSTAAETSSDLWVAPMTGDRMFLRTASSKR